MQDKPFLLTGGHGRLGLELQKKLYCDAPLHTEMDVLKNDDLEKKLSSAVYAGVIHLAALTDPAKAAAHPQESYRLNVTATRHVAQISARHKFPIYYLSTDYVFDGREGNYRESDLPAPANWYGFTKYAGELEIQDQAQDHCIIRTSFRPALWPFATAFTNVYTSADYTDVIAQEIVLCIKRNIRGVIHIGTATKTFFDLARQRNPQVQPEECKDNAFPKRRHLNIDRWSALRKEIVV